MKYTSMMMTGSRDGLEKVRKEIDSLPYERFPFCCGGRDDTVKQDYDMSRKPVVVVQEITMVREPEQPRVQPKAKEIKYRARERSPPKPKVFWTAPLVSHCLSIKSVFR